MKFVLFYNDSAIYVKCNCNSLGKSHKNINPEAPFSRWLRPWRMKTWKIGLQFGKGRIWRKLHYQKSYYIVRVQVMIYTEL